MKYQAFVWLRRVAAPLAVLVAVACSEVPTVAPVDSQVASFGRNKNIGPGKPDDNKSCDGNSKGKSPNEKNQCGPTEPPVTPSFRFDNQTKLDLTGNLMGYRADCTEEGDIAGIYISGFITENGDNYVSLCPLDSADPATEYNVRFNASEFGQPENITSVTPSSGQCIKGGSPVEWYCNIREPNTTIKLETTSEPPAPLFASYALLYNNGNAMIADDINNCGAAAYAPCPIVKAAADVDGDGKIFGAYIAIHGASTDHVPFSIAGPAGFDKTKLTKVSLHKADGTVLVSSAGGFYYTSIYYWGVFLDDLDGTWTPALGTSVNDSTADYFTVTYDGKDYKYYIVVIY
jgi:hypothetical protein